MKVNRNDNYSPNHVIASIAICLFCYSALCGGDLWIPASRIANLHARAVVLSVCDAAASFSDYAGFSAAAPALKTAFVSAAGLQGNSSWDTRYYNRREIDRPAIGERSSPEVSVQDAVPETGIEPPAAVAAVPLPESAAGFYEPSPPESASGLEAVSPPEVAAEDSGSPAADGHIPPESPVKEVKADEHYQSTGKTLAMDSSDSRNLVFSKEYPLEMYLFGDSQVFSLGSGLSRLVGRNGMIKVDYLAIHSSGFIRSDYFDWPGKLADTFSGRHYSAAAVMLGMNDYQNFRGRDGKILKKNTPEWERVYREKCRGILDLLLEEVPRVYWLGMPRVKNKVYDESLRYIDRVQESVAGEYSPDLVVRIPILDCVPGRGKPYADSIVDSRGRSIRVMSDDGTHFTVEGGQLAMKSLFDRMAADHDFAENPVAHLPD